MNIYLHYMIYGFDPNEPVLHLRYSLIGVTTEDSYSEAMTIAYKHAHKFATSISTTEKDEEEGYILFVDADNPDYEQPLAFICHHDHYREQFDALMEADMDEEIDMLISGTYTDLTVTDYLS